MKPLLPVLALPLLLAACAEGNVTLPPFLGGPTPDEIAAAEEAELAAAPVPAEVAPYLPPGVPGSLVMLDVNGCYVFSIERMDPQVGFPVLNQQGEQVCPTPAVEG